MVFYSFRGHIHFLGYLFAGFVGNPAHDENTAGLFRQLLQSPVDYFFYFIGEKLCRFTDFQGRYLNVQFPFGHIPDPLRYIFLKLFTLQVVQAFMLNQCQDIGRNIGVFTQDITSQ